MAEVYGQQVGQGLADEDWLSDVGERGWVVLLKDTKIRYRPAELGAITTHGIPGFLSNECRCAGMARVGSIVVSVRWSATGVSAETPPPRRRSSAACPGAADPDDRSSLISAVYLDALARPKQACGATHGGLCCELNARLAVPGTVGQFQARGEAPVVDRPPQVDDRSASGAYDSRRRSTSAWAGFSDPRDAFSSRDLLRARRLCDALRSRVPRRTHP
jgi:hypothetical protein